jgi:hypothetical protein
VTTDPWGNTIQYTNVTPQVNAATLDGNVAFTLTSWGPDGLSGTPDDISINVYVGQIRQQISNY